MNAVILTGMMAVAVVGGWYGRSILGRIRSWGEKLNEIDELYQSVASPEEMAGQTSSVRAGGSPVTPRHAVALGPRVPHGTV